MKLDADMTKYDMRMLKRWKRDMDSASHDLWKSRPSPISEEDQRRRLSHGRPEYHWNAGNGVI